MTAKKKETRGVQKAKSNDLPPRKVADRDAARIKGGRKDRLSSNHNQTIR
ncbi:MAG TPA: hypothetical protein VMJ30_04910 [Gemmatimonadales bacterium]|nr:hypothetical protein [Gemmatimonadales bacterium]